MKKRKVLLIPLSFVLVFPSLLFLLLGYIFQGQVLERVPFAIANHDGSALSISLTKMIDENDMFDVLCYADTDAEVEAGLKKGTFAAAIIIPEHFGYDVSNGNTPRLLVLYDNVQLVSAGNVKGKISEIISTLHMGSVSGALQGSLQLSSADTAAMLQPISYSIQAINPGTGNMLFSLHGSLLSMVQVCVFVLALELTRRHHAYKPLIAIQNAVVSGFCGTISMVMLTVLQVGLYDFPFYGDKAAAFLLIFLYLTGIASLGILIRLLSKNKESAVSKCSVLMSMLLLSGYSYPLIAMPALVQKIASYIPFAHYGIPIRDIMLMGYGFTEIIPDIRWIIGFIVLLWAGFFFISAYRTRNKAMEASSRERIAYVETMVE